jgi:hypothetical protein
MRLKRHTATYSITHLVGAREYCGRNFETECFSGFAVDNKFDGLHAAGRIHMKAELAATWRATARSA